MHALMGTAPGYAPTSSTLAYVLMSAVAALDALNTALPTRPELQPLADKLRECVKECADAMQPPKDGPVVVMAPPFGPAH
jgi:hypothetical protein